MESEDSERGCTGQGASPVSDTVKQMHMQTTTTGCCLIRKESGSAMTQEILKQNECRTLIFYVRDFLARHSQSLDEGKDLPMQEEPFSLKLPDWLQTNDLRIFSLKTYPVCFRMTRGGHFAPSSVRFLNWGTMSNGKCLTARISESPSQGSGCILSDILIPDVPDKYFLSAAAMRRISGNLSAAPKAKGFMIPTE